MLHRCGNRELNESSGDFKVSVTISQTILTADEQFKRKAGLSFKFFGHDSNWPRQMYGALIKTSTIKLSPLRSLLNHD